LILRVEKVSPYPIDFSTRKNLDTRSWNDLRHIVSLPFLQRPKEFFFRGKPFAIVSFLPKPEVNAVILQPKQEGMQWIVFLNEGCMFPLKT